MAPCLITDTLNMTVRFPLLPVPLKATTHYCMIVKFPVDSDYHIVATQPLLDNKHAIHHILLYGCAEESKAYNDVVPYYVNTKTIERMLCKLYTFVIRLIARERR